MLDHLSSSAGLLNDTLESDLSRIRRHLHRYPELLFEVDQTMKLIAGLLRKWDIELHEQVGRHFHKGVIGILRGAQPGPVILLRADVDALPITEQNTAAYASVHEGVMHACGHDAHTAMLLGAARVLSAEREQLHGTIVFAFQPAEEGAQPSPLDGRLISGGRDLIEDGILEHVDQVFALHVWPQLETGQIGIHPGTAMAASSHFTITFSGTPGHHSTPHLASDSIIMAARFINDIKLFMATLIDPLESAVLSFGTLHAGTVKNAIAGKSELTGTFRTFDPQTVERITAAIEGYAKQIAAQQGGTAEVVQRTGTVLRNDPDIVRQVELAAQQVFGADGVQILEQPVLAGEDFALYTEQRPGAFAFIGCRAPDQTEAYPLHHPRFDIDEHVLLLGTRLHVQFARNALSSISHKREDV
ncbi:M20 metallopeptidase family protein [Paenibacillus sp. WLX1005]|uniref:M20 metallopeptidase family protein n=1 Tax=Paenibacillus sp. WLX1005 TaxID=3243766 RepID=UPI0039841C99